MRWHQPKESEEKIDVALMEHVSPIEWDNVILYGQYVLDRAQVRRCLLIRCCHSWMCIAAPRVKSILCAFIQAIHPDSENRGRP